MARKACTASEKVGIIQIGSNKGISSDVLSRIIVSAERYACGRMTYVVSASAMSIVRYAHLLSPEQKAGIISDIRDRASRKPVSPDSGITALGMDFDRRTWLDVLSALEDGTDFYEGLRKVIPANTIDTQDLRLLASCSFRNDIGYGKSEGSGIGLSLHEYAELFKALPEVFGTPGFRSNISRDLADKVTEWWPERMHVDRLTEDDVREVMEVAGDWETYRETERLRTA